MALEYAKLTGEVIGAAIAVHRELGPGFLKSVYDRALAVELRLREIPFQRQLSVPIHYRGIEIGLHRIGLFVADEIVVELKVAARFEDIHFATVRSYLNALNKTHGLLLNFGRARIDAKRVISDQP